MHGSFGRKDLREKPRLSGCKGGKEDKNMARIATKKGLKELKKRFQEVEPQKLEGANEGTNYERYASYWIQTIDGCIKDGLAMDEIDYENTPKVWRKLWRGLR